MLAVDVDLALEFREFSVRRAEKLADGETDRRAGLIEFVGFVGQRTGAQHGESNGDGKNL
jgi:hypothetical protein